MGTRQLAQIIGVVGLAGLALLTVVAVQPWLPFSARRSGLAI